MKGLTILNTRYTLQLQMACGQVLLIYLLNPLQEFDGLQNCNEITRILLQFEVNETWILLTAHSGSPIKWHAWKVATAKGSACRSAIPVVCKAPYTISLTSTNVQRQSQYKINNLLWLFVKSAVYKYAYLLKLLTFTYLLYLQAK